MESNMPSLTNVTFAGGTSPDEAAKRFRKFLSAPSRHFLETIRKANAAHADAHDSFFVRGSKLRSEADDANSTCLRFAQECENNAKATKDDLAYVAELKALAEEKRARYAEHQANPPRYNGLTLESLYQFAARLREPMAVRDDIEEKPDSKVLEKIRADIMGSAAEIKKCKSARLPFDESFGRWRSIVTKARRSCERIPFGELTRLRESDGGRLIEERVDLPERTINGQTVTDYGALMLLACEPHVLALGESRLRRLYEKVEFEDELILSKRERLERIEALRERIAGLEDREGAVLRAMLKAGMPFTVRKDADLSRMLGLIPAPVKAAEPEPAPDPDSRAGVEAEIAATKTRRKRKVAA
jgi:hypothetical protein